MKIIFRVNGTNGIDFNLPIPNFMQASTNTNNNIDVNFSTDQFTINDKVSLLNSLQKSIFDEILYYLIDLNTDLFKQFYLY